MTAKGIAKRYPKEQSKFFKCRSKSNLAELLKVHLPRLRQLAEAGKSGYKIFTQAKTGKKERLIQNPKDELKRIQRRIGRLIARIATPDYLHSAVKQRSYVSNADAHPCVVPVLSVDIKSFFENARRDRVYRFFSEYMQCSPDVSSLLANLTTIDGHLPTGAPTSQILSFYAYKPMFDELNDVAAKNGLKMTLYVDDLTFSGEASGVEFKELTRKIIQKYGLRISGRKCKISSASETKIVTGVALTKNGKKLPNRRQRAIHLARIEVKQATSPAEQLEKMHSLLMRLYEASQIEPRFKNEAERLRKRLAAQKKYVGES